MSNHESQVQNDNVSVTVSLQQGSQVKLDIFVTPKATAAAYSKAVKTISKEVSLPGFRKGKAPEAFILKNYGSHIQKEWQSILVETGFQEALNLIEMRPLKMEGVRCTAVKEISRENGSHFTIEFEASPTVPSVNLNEIYINPIDRSAVSQEDIDQSIENLRLYHAQWATITDRAVQESDYVDLDIEKTDEPMGNICKNTRFSVANGRMANWMRKLIIGLHTNESAEGMSEKEIEGTTNFQPTKCKITVKAIHEATLPQTDDAFSQKLGVPTFEELRLKVIEDLNRRADEEVREKLYQQIDDHLLEKYHFDIPASLIQGDKEKRITEKTSWLKQQNAPSDVINHQIAELEQSLPHEIDRSYRLLFLIFKFAREHDIIVSEDEIFAEYANQIAHNGENSPLLKGINDPGEIRSKLNHHLLLRKTRDYIAEHVKSF